ncbi:hypothetical protein NC651_039109 [Populus alba x Populus x berolinensis]|nr:hypothetical protein NC651_039109 [Populus alba x Populus x berolinensis]
MVSFGMVLFTGLVVWEMGSVSCLIRKVFKQ